MPLEAGSIADYAHRLKANGYYTDAEKTYRDGMTNWDSIIQKELLSDSISKNPIDDKEYVHGKKPDPKVNTDRRLNLLPKIADNSRLRIDSAKTNWVREQSQRKGLTDAELYKINPLLDLKGGIESRFGMPPAINNNVKTRNTKRTADLHRTGLRPAPNVGTTPSEIMPPAINGSQIMKNIFMGHPEIKAEWNKAGKDDNDIQSENLYPTPYEIPMSDTLRYKDIAGGLGKIWGGMSIR
jgi:hypothetical protein